MCLVLVRDKSHLPRKGRMPGIASHHELRQRAINLPPAAWQRYPVLIVGSPHDMLSAGWAVIQDMGNIGAVRCSSAALEGSSSWWLWQARVVASMAADLSRPTLRPAGVLRHQNNQGTGELF